MKNVIKVISLLFILTSITISYNSKYDSLIREFESTAKSKEALVNEYIELSSNFIDLMTIQGTAFLEQEEDSAEDSRLFSLLKYDPATDSYNMDAAEDIKDAGNLTGWGNIPKNGADRSEINLALQYNKFFSSMYSRLPDIAWLYYTSESNFINMYPWISSKDFSFDNDLKSTEFYKCANPKNNPLRLSCWTPVYLDHAGKGLMVTLSGPVYYNETFKGIVSLDLTNNQLSKIIESKYDSYLVDNNNSVIATSADIRFDKDVIKLNDVLKSNQDDIKRLMNVKKHAVTRVDMNYIYSVGFDDAPWKMLFILPVWLIVYQSVIYSLPILVICFVLFFIISEVEKRKKTEILLTASIEELKSYHELLENAAKFDFLTNTYNRRGLKEFFEKNVDLTGNNKIPVTFILGDIDYFKQLNDAFGHAAGDKVLIEIANLMKKKIRDTDAICRWGGEEFVIMLLNRSHEEAMTVAEEIRTEIEAIVISWENATDLKITMTFGVEEYNYTDSVDNIVANADTALYYGKKVGRNRVVSYRDIK